MEMVLAVLLAALAAGVATEKIQVPVEITSSSIAIAFMLIVVLALFSYSPVVGVAGIIFMAVLVFSRNVAKISTMTNYNQVTNTNVPRRNEYGDMNIYKETSSVMPYGSVMSGPRDYSQFRETISPSWSSSQEGFGSEQTTTYSSFGAEQYAVGQYPVDNQRQFSNPYVEEYKFRPSLDTGSNDFQRYGPNMDRKLEALAYQ